MKFNTLSFLALLGSVAAFAPPFGAPRVSTSLDARKPFISGNWKLNPQTKEEALTLASEIAASINVDTPDADIALFVPYVFIESAMRSVDGKINVGAEVSTCNCNICFVVTRKMLTIVEL
jgi:triosephosphate isomerase (TIM)